MLFSWLSHRRACQTKQDEQRQRISSLPPIFHSPLTPIDRAILLKSVETLVGDIQRYGRQYGASTSGEPSPSTQTSSASSWANIESINVAESIGSSVTVTNSIPESSPITPTDVLIAFSKQALKAHAATNCLTEVMIGDALTWVEKCNTQGPLAGLPISLKDTVGVAGYDSTIGYSAWAGRPFQQDAPLVRLLRDAGAIPFVKTNIPITLLSFESSSSIWGPTRNAHNPAYSPGGSSGGEAALLSLHGSAIGIGTDVAGSVRVPSHYSGVYTIKCSVGRFPKSGNATSIPGQEGVMAVYSPMARRLDDLEYFWKAVVRMQPWKYDPTVLPIPWRGEEVRKELQGKKLRWGVMWDDGIVRPSPACKRALSIVVDVLKQNGHEVVDVSPPSPYYALKLASSLLLADGGTTFSAPIRSLSTSLPFSHFPFSIVNSVFDILSPFIPSFLKGLFIVEPSDPGMVLASEWLRLPATMRWIYIKYVRYIKRDEIYAGLLEGFRNKDVSEFWSLIAQKEKYKLDWWEWWNYGQGGKTEDKLDFLLTVPNALPAVPHGGMKDGFSACGYTFLFNLLDYSAGVMPITKVSHPVDSVSAAILKPWRNAIEASAYRSYDASKMQGLPIGVQVVGQRLEEEKVMEGMKIVEDLLKKEGKEYESGVEP